MTDFQESDDALNAAILALSGLNGDVGLSLTLEGGEWSFLMSWGDDEELEARGQIPDVLTDALIHFEDAPRRARSGHGRRLPEVSGLLATMLRIGTTGGGWTSLKYFVGEPQEDPFWESARGRNDDTVVCTDDDPHAALDRLLRQTDGR